MAPLLQELRSGCGQRSVYIISDISLFSVLWKKHILSVFWRHMKQALRFLCASHFFTRFPGQRNTPFPLHKERKEKEKNASHFTHKRRSTYDATHKILMQQNDAKFQGLSHRKKRKQQIFIRLKTQQLSCTIAALLGCGCNKKIKKQKKGPTRFRAARRSSGVNPRHERENMMCRDHLIMFGRSLNTSVI